MAEADIAFMRRAIALARERLGRTGPNPAVGCVIVLGGEVVGEAATGEGGRPHAEEQALSHAGARAHGAAVYVTLEPCGERSSRAPSCAERLAASGVVRVLIASEDPSPMASGRGFERLEAAGVEIERGLLAEEAANLYAEYRERLARDGLSR
jgi:diaminohydroxyphosphoribosylaminopyrimidine deaminase/5-amino-6-(5-phosphoribosylamino)uracil reductase